MNQYHIIANQMAGSGKNQGKIDKIINQLNLESQKYQLYITRFAGEEKEYAKKIMTSLKPNERILVIGGDGTLSNVLQVVKKTPIGYIPTGTGNDFARGSGVSESPLEALAHFEKSQGKKINVIQYQINGDNCLAINNVGIGIDAAVVAMTNQSETKKWLNRFKLGKMSYILILLKLLFTKKAFSAEIKTENSHYKIDNIFLLTVTNHPYFGGGIPIWPEATIEDRDVDVVLIKRHNIIKLIYLLLLIVTKKQAKHPNIMHIKTNSLTIKTFNPEYVQADGEDLPKQLYDIKFSTKEHLFWL